MNDEYPEREPNRETDPDPSGSNSPTPPGQQPPPPPQPDQTSDEHDVESVLAGAGDFTSGEGLVAFAGMILLAVWLIFDVLLDSYSLGTLTILLAATVVILPRLDPEVVDRAAHGPTVMKLGGYAIAIIGVITLIGDIENTILDEVGAILGGLISYGAFVMAFLGARQIET